MIGGCPDKGASFFFFFMNIIDTVTAYTNYVTELSILYTRLL